MVLMLRRPADLHVPPHPRHTAPTGPVHLDHAVGERGDPGAASSSMVASG